MVRDLLLFPTWFVNEIMSAQLTGSKHIQGSDPKLLVLNIFSRT
jgi:hypothetical protein